MRRRIALFDFDGTLTRHDTFITFARHACGRSRFLKAFVRSLPALVRWKLGLGTNSKAKETLFGNLYRGMAADEFERLCATFADVVVHDLNESGMSLTIISGPVMRSILSRQVPEPGFGLGHKGWG